LHVCAERNFTEIGRAIIESDKERHSKLVFERTAEEEGEDELDKGGQTALHVACEWGSMEMIELLCSVGGEQLIRTKNGAGMDSIEYSYAENMEEPFRYLKA
jgi:ankyrin repeat protein